MELGGKLNHQLSELKGRPIRPATDAMKVVRPVVKVGAEERSEKVKGNRDG